MITRGLGDRWPNDLAITDRGAAGLHASSVIRFKLFTLDNRIIRRLIGKLARRDADACGRALTAMLVPEVEMGH